MLSDLYALAHETFVVLLGYAGFMVLERLYAAERGQPSAHLRFNLLYLVCYQLATFLLLPIATSLIIGGLVAHLGGPWLRVQTPIDTVVGITARGVLWLMTFDLFYYAFHRLQHTWPLLWRQHRLHHLEPSVNVTTTLRHHWLEEPLRVVFIVAPMTLLLDLHPLGAGLVGLVLSLWGIFIHANVRLQLGSVGKLLVGPQSHRIHHSLEARHRDRNFAAFFSMWDRLGGTYCEPLPDEFPATGIAGEPPLTSVLRANLLPFLGHAPLVHDGSSVRTQPSPRASRSS